MLLLILFAAEPCLGGTLAVRVVGVVDGDTIDVLNGQTSFRVRIWGIDSPEKSQAFGRRAKVFTSAACFGKTVSLVEHGYDRYGRMVAQVALQGEGDLGEELVRADFAWWFVRYSPKDRVLASLEREAREARRGLWRDDNPIPPWMFRRHGHGKGQGRGSRHGSEATVDAY